MIAELDTREYSTSVGFDPEQARRQVQSFLPPNHIVEIRGVNRFLGSAQQIRSKYPDRDYRRQIETRPDDELVASAQEHLRLISPALGFGSREAPEFVVSPLVKVTTTGERVITAHQTHRGVPIFQMERAIWIDPDGTVNNVSGASVGLPNEMELLPRVSVERALFTAVSHLSSFAKFDSSATDQGYRINLAEFAPRVLARHQLPAQPAVLDRGLLGDAVPAHLVLFYQGPRTRLGWHLLITAPEHADQCIAIVEADSQTPDAANPGILYLKRTAQNAEHPHGSVWLNNPRLDRSFDKPVVTAIDRDSVPFPRPKEVYPADPLVAGFPFDWIDGDMTKAQGNCVIAVQRRPGTSFDELPEGARLVLIPDDKIGDDQKTLNAFYFCNFMHDFFYSLGFDERAGNFQRLNRDESGIGGDPVIASITDQRIFGAATFMTLADGSRAVLEVGAVENGHGALDADVMYHEYVHGVTDRLVGSPANPQPLQKLQSAGMSEGWSDYFALTVQNFYLGAGLERSLFGDCLRPGVGLRTVRYDDEAAEKGCTFQRVETRSDPHDIGEIWCAALMKMNRDLRAVFFDPVRPLELDHSTRSDDFRKGHLLGWQIVLAGLQHTPANPNFIQGRDAIVHALECRRRSGALDDAQFRAAYKIVWTAFAHFGIGPQAKSDDSTLNGIEEDRDEDEQRFPAPDLIHD